IYCAEKFTQTAALIFVIPISFALQLFYQMFVVLRDPKAAKPIHVLDSISSKASRVEDELNKIPCIDYSTPTDTSRALAIDPKSTPIGSSEPTQVGLTFNTQPDSPVTPPPEKPPEKKESK
ncbi:MAG TPA: hypothetical protein VGM34_02310, partial [Chlamydiales bacterium]